MIVTNLTSYRKHTSVPWQEIISILLMQTHIAYIFNENNILVLFLTFEWSISHETLFLTSLYNWNVTLNSNIIMSVVATKLIKWYCLWNEILWGLGGKHQGQGMLLLVTSLFDIFLCPSYKVNNVSVHLIFTLRGSS